MFFTEAFYARVKPSIVVPIDNSESVVVCCVCDGWLMDEIEMLSTFKRLWSVIGACRRGRCSVGEGREGR